MLRRLLGPALATVAATAVAYLVRSVTRPRKSSFTVLTWNVLAAEFTSYNRQPPGCVQGHKNPTHKLETRTQTAARYSIATDALLNRAPDAALLQELSADFFDSDINPRAAALLAQFEVAHVTNAAGPGTAVLLCKGGALTNAGVTFTAGASEELTGGTSKSASAVLVTLEDGTHCWIVSVHLTPHKFNPKAVSTHLKLLADAIRANTSDQWSQPASIVVGGDLNADLLEVIALQHKDGFLGSLSHVKPASPTGLSADFSEAQYLDHFFISPGLLLDDDVVLERAPGSPYGVGVSGEASPVIAASDHVWQSIRIIAD